MAKSPAASGGAGLQDVPSAPRTKDTSNMVRVFISSTLTDMSSERKALLDKAYPEVFAFCRSLGLVFEVVDLHWGVRGAPCGDHGAAEIFLQEIRRCQRTSAGPAFVALLGSRYGHRALPRLIQEKLFISLLSTLSKDPEGAEELRRWYLRDDNAVPPVYVLQSIAAHFPHYDDLRPENSLQRERDAACWRAKEARLLEVLRRAAAAAEAAGDITAEEKQQFNTSGLEQQFELGLWKDDAALSALVFVRDAPRHRGRAAPKGLSRFKDLTADALMDVDAQRLLAGLKSRLHGSCQKVLNLHCVELIKGGVDPKRGEHAQYLDSVCQQFVAQMKARITAALGSSGQRKIWGRLEEEKQEVAEEAAWGSALGARPCAGVCGREALLGKLCFAIWESAGSHHGPLVVHGAAGMGKTALLCKLAQEMGAVLEGGAVVVVRLLSARHPHRPDVVGVLRSLLLQICQAHGASWRRCRSGGNTLLIVLDALDQLSDLHHAHKLYWLPTSLPPRVHLVVSMDTNSEMFANAQLKLDSDVFFEVGRLAPGDGRKIMESYLRAERRSLTPEQADGILRLFASTGSPLHLRLMLAEARRWTSFAPRAEARLGASTEATVAQLFVRLEEAHGQEVVAGALGYLALAREGLLEAELRDVMSLDDDVIGEVYRYFPPPSPSLIRLPPLLWARLRRDLVGHLEERWTDGVASITFTHRCLREAVSARYLTAVRRERRLRHLAEYFLGRWAGKLKPTALPGLSFLLSDRKVSPQPLWVAPGVANVRKLQELTYHLLHAGLWEELRQEVIGNAEWLYCKIRVCGVSSAIQDLDQCSQHMDCTETSLVRDALVLMRPTMDFLDGQLDASLFYTELLARLRSLATPFPAVIGQLCGQCEGWLLACPQPVLVPKCSFLQPPGGALQHTLTGLCAGVVCVEVSVAADLLVAGSDDGRMAVWNLTDRQLVHSLFGHTGAVLAIKVVESCAGCLSLAADCSLRRWSLVTGQQLLCIHNVLDPAPSAHLHLFERERLLFVCSSTQVKVWNLDHADGVTASSCSSCVDEGSVVLGVLGGSVVSVAGGRLRIFNPVNGAQTETVFEASAGHLNPAVCVLLQKHQKVLLVSEDGSLHQVSRTSKRMHVFRFPVLPSLLSVTDDENTLITGRDRTLTLFSIRDDSVDQFLVLHHDDAVVSCCVSSDCRLIVSGAADHMIRVWSWTSGALLDTLCSEVPITTLVLLKDFLLSASAASSCIHLWSLRYDARHKPAAHVPSGSAHMAITKDADQIFYVRHQNQMEVFSWNNHKGARCVSECFQVSAEVSCLELLQHKRLLLCGLTSGTVLIYPLALPLETLCIPPPESLCKVICLASSPQEKHLAVAYEDCVRLFEITTRDNFPTVEGPLQVFPLSLLQGPLSSMALLSNHRLLYGTLCGEVTLLDLQAGVSSQLEPHRSRVTCVTASNWETHVLVGSEDAVQRVWSLNPLVLDHTMEYKGLCFEGVLSAAFSESDQFVFTGSQDRTIKVWDVASGNLLMVQYVYSPIVRMVTFRNGFVALSQCGAVIREAFHCPDHISPDYKPLKNVQAHYRVTSREQNQHPGPSHETNLQGFNPAQLNVNLLSMLKTKPSSTCMLL
ncbi:hypothetical protein fugu_006310 [Takifugu bimaculatus]|uniref:AAA+ ATPase domain-containing protein n=1 Tax=Takifugu bimaculatus TaxID=433685 RepID=A0A4Z2B8D9_9TELE|nr:hypothetical protein fugu_006310 [Takifugu bimaculatus]